MMKNIIGQAIYMVAVLLVVLMTGEYFIPEDCYFIEDDEHPGRFVFFIPK